MLGPGSSHWYPDSIRNSRIALILPLYISQRTIYPQGKSVHQAMLSASPNHQQLTNAIIAAKAKQNKAKQSKMVLRKVLFVLHEYRYYLRRWRYCSTDMTLQEFRNSSATMRQEFSNNKFSS
jgi:hypothetical protein